MKLSLAEADLMDYVSNQCNYFFPDANDINIRITVKESFDYALSRTEYCFSRIKLRGYGGKGEAEFNHLHSDQYSQFLYYLANSIWKLQPEHEDVCRKLIMLNKTLNACWFSYKGNLPKVFLLSHPVGTVLGNAPYGEYAVFNQNVTVMTASYDSDGKTMMHIGDFLYMSSGAKIIGNSDLGNDVTLGVDTVIHKKKIKDNMLIFRNDNGVIESRSNHISKSRSFFYFD